MPDRYNQPTQGTTNWHLPLNSNFQDLDIHVEHRGPDADKSNVTHAQGAKYLATDTGSIYISTGSAWDEIGTIGSSGGGETFGSATDPVSSIANTSYREDYDEQSISGNYTIDATTANVHELTLTGDATLSIDDTGGDTALASSLMVVLKQDSTGGHSVTWGSDIRWHSGTEPSLTTTANEGCVISFSTLWLDTDMWIGFKAADSVNLVELGSSPASTPQYIQDHGRAWWPFYEGGRDTVHDALNTHDGTINGASWIENVGGWVEDYALSFSGGEDVTVAGGLGGWGANLDTMAMAGTFTNTDASTREDYFRARDGGEDQWVVVALSNTTVGELTVWIQDSTGVQHELETSSPTDSSGNAINFTDGSKYRFVWNKTGNDISSGISNAYSLWINGDDITSDLVAQSNNGTLNSGGSDWDEFTDQVGFGSQVGNNQYHWNGDLDDPVIFNSDLTSTEVADDWNRQPWSS